MCHESWHSWLHTTLQPPAVPASAPLVLDLFAGCGGLALGFEACGFRSLGFEMKSPPAQTYAANLDGDCRKVTLQLGMPEEQAEIIIGGPPCQPFSQIGYQRGKRDPRDGFPIFLDAVRRIRPKIAIVENVRGLLYRNKDYLRLAMQELEKFGYSVDARILKAVDYGVPQNRERVIIVGSTVGWQWPVRWFENPVTAGVALGPMATHEDEQSKYLTPQMDRYIAEYERRSNCVNPRDLHLDKPARTVTCRNLGAATSDMLRLRLPSGERRRLTVQEGARLQSFPDWFQFAGNEYDQCEQIGNAVPPLMGLALAQSAREALNSPSTCNRSFAMTTDLLATDPAAEKVEQALNILRHVGVPIRDLTARRRQRVAKALLAVGHVKPMTPWAKASSYFEGTVQPITTREIIKFWNEYYSENLADSSYDDVRRKDLLILNEAGLVVRSAANPAADINDGTRGYAMPTESLALIRSYGGEDWEDQLVLFRQNVGTLKDKLSKAREFQMVPVTLPDGSLYRLSPGPHNKIQKAIVEEFLPRFSKGAQVLYLGDAAKKILHMDADQLRAIGIAELSRDMLPDILAYEAERNWLFLIEAVHSSNPIGKLRHHALRRLVRNTKPGCVFVSAFETLATFSRFSKQISWETEAWIASDPDHMIHFDGERFLGPYE